jgi:protease-4
MESNPRSLPARFASGLERSRRFFANALFLGFSLFLVGLFVALLLGGPKVPRGGALVVQPKGDIVEQLTARSAENLLSDALTGDAKEVLLKDLLDAIAAAKDDVRIGSLFLDLSEMGSAGMTKLQDLRSALLDFRKSGKKVVAYADGYTQGPYYLAAAADEVWMHPLGAAGFEGLGRWRTYYKDAIDRLEIDWHVFRVGEYKSFVEPFIRNDMSPEARQADSKWLSALWTGWLDDVAAARKLKPEQLKAYIDGMPERLAAAKGDLAKVAVEARLVDKLGQRDQIRARMIELAGEDKKEKTFQQVSVADYLASRGGDRSGARGGGDAIAVIVAKGDILDGKQPAGRIGGDSTAALVRKARQDKKVKAIVLRVDSPGGSAFASEVIRRELVVARAEGKKVVVSMGTVAASGGYWISTASDEIWASPQTITGSIGIFGMFPTFEKPLAKYLGVRVDGVGTTRFSGIRVDRPLEPEVGRMIQLAIEHGYESFLARVAEARKMTRDEVDKIARGRVWSGADAKERKLVDKLGGLEDAIASAAQMAGLQKGHRVWYVEADQSFAEKVMAGLRKGGARLGIELVAPEATQPSALARAIREQLGNAGRLLSLNDPHGVYVHCLCDAR